VGLTPADHGQNVACNQPARYSPGAGMKPLLRTDGDRALAIDSERMFNLKQLDHPSNPIIGFRPSFQ
jgi:hypothetical protein